MTSLQALLDEGLEGGLYSGAAAGTWSADGSEFAVAGTHAYGDDTRVRLENVFDLASITKTFTAAVLLRLVESGALDLDEPVSAILPVGTGDGAPAITLRMLLTHTSGLPDSSFLWRDDPGIAPGERRDAILATLLVAAPGAEYRYSCLGYIAAAAIAERVASRPYPELLAELVTEPLGLSTVRYGPIDSDIAVATEEQPWAGRGLLRGEVHDETAWFLGGVSGNAGLFGAAPDVLAFARTFVDGGLLNPDTLRLATTDQLPAGLPAPHRQGMGPWIDEPEIFGEVHALGHPGFTGTLWLAIPESGRAAVLLTNRVHPSRDRVNLDPFRRRFTAWVAGQG